jgi:hypothetical protein
VNHPLHALGQALTRLRGARLDLPSAVLDHVQVESD